MIEVEQPEGISTRKLVLETARHNVITAYTGEAGAQLLRRFPNVDVAVVHTELDDSSFHETIAALRRVRKDLKVIGISPFSDRSHDGADYMLKSHNPQDLLRLLAEEFEAELSDTDAE
jgi:DNA-binding response OmpR family regulator